ncbi:MAG: hypothetical protein KU37_06355 [Sulfuricurvum sp. PC08-66]|nr:MAG: hypothetical protein KU37_06355 [Sulfuricurvum sp. PC08-66]
MKILFKESFKTRFNRQLAYIAQDNKTAAIQFRDALREKIAFLKESPLIYRQSIYFDNPLIRDLPIKATRLPIESMKKPLKFLVLQNIRKLSLMKKKFIRQCPMSPLRNINI